MPKPSTDDIFLIDRGNGQTITVYEAGHPDTLWVMVTEGDEIDDRASGTINRDEARSLAESLLRWANRQ
jgi:hypothetical protein